MSYRNPSSPMDYTNNDFRAIFPELIEVVKTLSSKWDPSIANESDPGVILLKLNAIVADKNNYNIDKNILEAFPETLTQDVSARMLYKQLGYDMPWYSSAETRVQFKYIGALDDISTAVGGWKLTIPKYSTMVTNETGDIVYTLLDDVEITRDSLTASASAIQGIWTDLKIAGSNELTYSNLDANNRIYFDDHAVPENGIFVVSYDGDITHPWSRVNNIAAINAYDSQYYYEFGVDPQSGAAYIEFPQNAADLISEKFTVSYVVSQGSEGAVAAQELTKFYSDVTARVLNNSELSNQLIDSETIAIRNSSASQGGTDPEKVSDAYRSFRKVVGTFDTYVTLRDYINAVFNSAVVSNAQVSDRYHDIQSSITVITDNVGNSDAETFYDGKMTAYELKLYLVGTNNTIRSVLDYNNSFSVEQGSQQKQTITSLLQDAKCISHDFTDYQDDLPIVFRNHYAIQIRFIPKYRLSSIELMDVKQNLVASLTSLLNARNVDFGQETSYDTVYNALESSDSRIQTLILGDFRYTTYAVYRESGTGEFKSIPVSHFDNDSNIIRCTSVDANGVASGSSVELSNKPDELKEYYLIDANQNCYRYDTATRKWYLYSELITEFQKWVTFKNILSGVTPFCQKDSEFTRNVDMKSVTEVDNVNRVSTNLDIEVKGGASYKLRSNETIQMFSPELAGERNFSTSVKVCAANMKNIDTTFYTDTPYQLKPGEKIIFFTQESDGDTAPYSVFVYEGTDRSDSPVVKCTFDLPVNKISSDVVTNVDTTPPESVNIATNLVNNQKIYSSDDRWAVIRNNMYGSYDLTGTQEVNIMKIAQVTNTDGYFYFITNNIDTESNEFVLTLGSEQVNSTTSNDSDAATPNFMKNAYVLDTNEYFFFVDKRREGYEVLGPGTLLRFNDLKNGNLEFRAPVLDAFKISEEGLSSFESALISLSDVCKSLLMRQQSINVAASGDVISNDIPTSVNEEGTPEYPTVHLVTTEYKKLDSLRASIGGSNVALAAPTYNGSDTDPTLTLYGKATLNLDVSPYTAQKVSNAIDKDERYSSIQQICLDNGTTIEDGQSFLTSHPTVTAGGTNISIAYTDLLTGSTIPQSLLMFKEAEESQVVVKLSPSLELDLNPPKNTFYILPVKIEFPDEESQGLEVEGSATFLGYNTNTFKPVKGSLSRTAFLLVTHNDVENSSSITFNGDNITLTFSNFYRYVYNTNLMFDNLSSLLEAVSTSTTFMKDTGFLNFKWDHQSDSSDTILDPLDAAEFFNTLHSCNRFTIPVAQLSFLNRDTRDSLIQVINNR